VAKVFRLYEVPGVDTALLIIRLVWEGVVLGERCGLLSHATWPRLPLLPTVNGSQLTRPRTFIVRYGGETFSGPVQNLAAQLMCRGTWRDQIVPGTR